MYRSILISCILFLAAFGVHAQTPEQVEMLEAMSPEQREQVLEQLTEQGVSRSGQKGPEFPPLVMDRSLRSLADDGSMEEEEPRIAADSTIVVSVKLAQNLSARQREEIKKDLPPRLAALLGSSVFELNRSGVLVIDDYYSIPLSGLLAEEAAVRIKAEPDFRRFEIEVSLLPLDPTGVAALPRFGYELFAGVPTTFAPATDIPVPTDYVIGPGDTVIVQLFGNQNERYELAVTREGNLQIPEIGPVSVKGLTFADMRVELQTRIQEQMIGVESSIALGELRSIRVFVLGDAEQPGSYTVSGLSTITNALFVSGGIKAQGSLRRIQLKRNGRTIQTLDLYRLLLDGDTRADVRLQPGDAIFVPPVGKTTSVGGEVLRPATYEIRNEKTVRELIELAGGLLPSAFPYSARLDRIGADARRAVLDIDLSTASGSSAAIRDGDVLWVEPVLAEIGDGVVVSGHVHRPGGRQFSPGMRLSELIRDSDELRPRADLRYVLIRRETGPSRTVEVFSADLSQAWAHRGSSDDPALQSRDRVLVFSIDPDRADRVAP
ncbi:MAG: SLBB domain-containing protein, partial [Gammaproteobacteria bacterium]|nr:SLBB domain-containing protein [Gammaproteobacteria bacterium]